MSRRLAQDPEYGQEFIIPIEGGGTIRTSTYMDSPEGSDYVRVCDVEGNEVAYWVCDEWEAEPLEVMGAILGAAGTTIKDRLPICDPH